MSALPLVVISFYDRRPVEPLEALLDSLDRHPAGAAHERVICVNAGGGPALPDALAQRVQAVHVRANDGMNIGAWNAAWQRWNDRPAYLFLQDECRAVTDGWLDAYLCALADAGVGLVGECLNPSWEATWEALRDGPGRARLPEHEIDGVPANRVDVYLAAMRRFGIDPGATGRHLRALAWATTGDVMRRIGGFPQGRGYGECIAAEIGVSRAVEAAGLRLRQVGPAPFHVFRHREWNQDTPGGPFTHRPVQLMELQALRAEVERLRERQAHGLGRRMTRLLAGVRGPVGAAP